MRFYHKQSVHKNYWQLYAQKQTEKYLGWSAQLHVGHIDWFMQLNLVVSLTQSNYIAVMILLHADQVT